MASPILLNPTPVQCNANTLKMLQNKPLDNAGNKPDLACSMSQK